MTLVPILVDLSAGLKGYIQNGTLMEDMPEGLLFTGKRGHSFTFEMSPELLERARKLHKPVALVDLDTLCAQDITGDYFEEITHPEPTQRY